MAIGHSISISGACLTVIDFQENWFAVEAVHETLRKTTLGDLRAGSKVNLERALKFSDRLGGHLVSGHVDAVGQVSATTTEGFSKVLTFDTNGELAPFFVDKGSVAVEGVSLTVWDLNDTTANAQASAQPFSFKVALIPHTLKVTTLGDVAIGSRVNIETDLVARYVARWLEPSLTQHKLLNPLQRVLLEQP
jgi:riboflavin synthase